MIPMQVLADIDNSRNPMQLSKERLERAATENQFMNGKIAALTVSLPISKAIRLLTIKPHLRTSHIDNSWTRLLPRISPNLTLVLTARTLSLTKLAILQNPSESSLRNLHH
jgi:hypothetical protein